jgi:hypothetical protein
MLRRRKPSAWHVLAAFLVGALLTLVVLNAAHGGRADCLLFLPLFCFALLPPSTATWRAPTEETLILALDPLLASAASRAPPAI